MFLYIFQLLIYHFPLTAILTTNFKTRKDNKNTYLSTMSKNTTVNIYHRQKEGDDFFKFLISVTYNHLIYHYVSFLQYYLHLLPFMFSTKYYHHKSN